MLSVTCTKCNAHYTMSEELYRRKGGGQAVIVTCKRCKAEIRFDAAPEAQEKPTHRSLPKPKVAVSKALEASGEEQGPFIALSSGFFGPGMASAPTNEPARSFPGLPEIESSLDSVVDSAAVQPTRTPAPVAAGRAVATEAAPELIDDDEAMSIRSTDMLDESVTVPLVAPKAHGTGTLRRFPAPPPPRRKHEEEEVDEPAPPSSSGTPTLTTLMGESSASIPPWAKAKKPDEFLMSLGASPNTALGPPTIDLSTIDAPDTAAPESVPPSPSEPAPSEPGSVAPTARKKKKRRAGSRSTAPSARPAATRAGSQPSLASAPVAKSAAVERRDQPQRSLGVWAGVAVLVALGIGAVLFKSPKKAQVVAQNEPAATTPIAPTSAAPASAPSQQAAAQPEATTSAVPAPIASPPTAENKDRAVEAKPSESAAKEAAVKEPAEKVAEAAAAPEKAEKAEKAEATAPAEGAAPPAEPALAQHGPFQADAAKAALADAAAQAAACRKGDDPTGNAAIIITFAPSGRVTSATISGPPFAGTATGGCIASTMRRAKVPPFDGDKITVSKTIYVQ